jgi:predicted dehydrogenase
MIWLIGAGGMSVEYVKVLKAQNQEFSVIGRSEKSALSFEEKTGEPVIIGGLDSFLQGKPELSDSAIVSVGLEQLFETTMQLLDYGVKHLLVEKPGGLQLSEIKALADKASDNDANIYIAYNRRFYSSTLKAQELIEQEGGVTSFNFELTEWGHVIEKLDKPKIVLEKWFLGNSTHVADMAFFLGGKPKEIRCFTSGSLSWHSSSSIYAGAGVSHNGALFNYAANWESAGRWSVEILTNENRYVFRPMESLQVQKRGTIPLMNIAIDDELDKEFKPGLYKQVEAFVSNESKQLCSIEEQLSLFPLYEKMANYR